MLNSSIHKNKNLLLIILAFIMQCSQIPQNIPNEEPDYYLNNTV